MPRFNPAPLKERIKLRRRQTKNNEIVLPAIDQSKRVEVRYRKDLNRLVSEMTKDVREVIAPVVRSYIRDSFVVDIRLTKGPS